MDIFFNNVKELCMLLYFFKKICGSNKKYTGLAKLQFIEQFITLMPLQIIINCYVKI